MLSSETLKTTYITLKLQIFITSPPPSVFLSGCICGFAHMLIMGVKYGRFPGAEVKITIFTRNFLHFSLWKLHGSSQLCDIQREKLTSILEISAGDSAF